MNTTFCRIVRLFRCVLVLLVLPAVGCSTTTLFTSYTSKINPLIDEVEARQFDHPLMVLNKYREKKDKILYLLERGRIAQIKNDADTSMTDYEAAIDAVRDTEEKAIVSASDVGAQAASLVTNENAIPYKGDGYEKVFMYQFQAFNYLAKKDIEGAGVEVRRANLEHELALERHEKELAKAEEAAGKKNLNMFEANNKLNMEYQVMDEVAGKVKSSFQNAYTFYMSGIVYELLGQPNDAYIDYKKALQIFPENICLQRDVLRLARDLGMNQEYEGYVSKFGNPLVTGKEGIGNINSGELVVFFEDGLVPQKKEIRIPLPTPNGLVAVAFPIYSAKWSYPRPLIISEGGYTLGFTEPICYVQALAVKSLKEEAPALIIRQLLRLAAKGGIQYGAMQATKDNQVAQIAALIFTSAYNIISERADVRSWLTLPNDVQIMRIHFPEGVHRLNLTHESPWASIDIDVAINQNKITILRVIRIGRELYTQTVVF